MRRVLSIIFTIIILLCCLTPSCAFAYENKSDNDLKYSYTTYQSDNFVSVEGVSLYSTNLIIKNSINISKDGTKLIITGLTQGTSDVVKCGFTKVIVQRKKSSTNSWSNYKTYEDLYSNSNKYNLNKSLTVESGYQYRVTVTHYAKKSIFSTQKIDSATSYLTF